MKAIEINISIVQLVGVTQALIEEGWFHWKNDVLFDQDGEEVSLIQVTRAIEVWLRKFIHDFVKQPEWFLHKGIIDGFPNFELNPGCNESHCGLFVQDGDFLCKYHRDMWSEDEETGPEILSVRIPIEEETSGPTIFIRDGKGQVWHKSIAASDVQGEVEPDDGDGDGEISKYAVVLGVEQ